MSVVLVGADQDTRMALSSGRTEPMVGTVAAEVPDVPTTVSDQSPSTPAFTARTCTS